VASGAEAASWIPILGRSAAGVAHFWSSSAEGAGLTKMEDLIRRGASAEVQHVRAALATGDGEDAETAVQVVTLRSVAVGQASEFIVAPGLKARHRDAFALRIDGDSMTPEIRHGDIVVASPSCPAADGRPAIIQLVGQIGVTCKLYRRVGDRIHLVPVNEHYDPASYESDKVDWAFSVLARVRC
jgi:phage repressor protein C with HTH and peptisase S24 domain